MTVTNKFTKKYIRNDEGRSQTERSQVVSDSVIDEKMDNEYKKNFMS